MKIEKATAVERRFLNALGLAQLDDFEVPDQEYGQALAEAARQHPEETPAEQKARALARVAFRHYGHGGVSENQAVKQWAKVRTLDWWARWVWRVLVVVGIWLIFGALVARGQEPAKLLAGRPGEARLVEVAAPLAPIPSGLAQVGGLDCLRVQDEGVTQKQWCGGIAAVDFAGAGVSCSFASGKVTCTIAGGGGSHNFLSATHTDTLAASVVRGDMIVGNATPAWVRVAHPGIANRFWRANAADPSWAQVDLATADVTGTLAIGNGGTGATTSQGAINAISQLTTNGDLLFHNGTNSTRLARGADGECLKATAASIAYGSCVGGPTYVYKTADETISSDSTLSDDAALKFAASANTKYLGEIFFWMATVAAADFKFGLNCPASPTSVRWNSLRQVWGGTTLNVGALQTACGSVTITATSSGDGWIRMDFFVENGASAGTIALQWAQNTSDPGNTTVQKGSWLRYQVVP